MYNATIITYNEHTIRYEPDVETTHETWHYASGKPVLKDNQRLFALTIDGQDLEGIIIRFHNIPYCYGSCTWQGEMAQFIFDNL